MESKKGRREEAIVCLGQQKRILLPNHTNRHFVQLDGTFITDYFYQKAPNNENHPHKVLIRLAYNSKPERADFNDYLRSYRKKV